ncbi:DUF4139 domain-containing protein [Paenisporosarcina sp. TG20]|uniref:DUF4139 domain-containing protein n=1 Tax=Paenisporosarcina sp. TG20 TaxID=1211706 RepID=UPI0002D28B69|nr:DUF4139 domain-containing protein [Paenisporosarcina sp. TG20]
MPTMMPSILTKDLALTVYNDGFALIQEVRTIPPLSDDHLIHYLDVPQLIEPNSLQVKGLQVAELNYEYDLVDKFKLLEKYVGRKIKLVDKETGVEKAYRLLSAQNGLVLEDLVTHEIVLDAEGETRLPDLPDGLILNPTLVWRIRQQTAEDARVTYLTRGLSWDVDYVAQVRENDFDLTGWVTLTNNSGMTYRDAKLKLMAGTVHRVPRHIQKSVAYIQEETYQIEPEHQAFADYHLYTMPEKVTIKDHQQKQLQLLSAYQIKSKMVYEVDSYSDHPNVYFTFENSAANELGIPLPKGRFKLYKENVIDGSSEFIGEDNISHTAVGEIVRIQSGEAFDITVESDFVAEYKKDGFEYEEVVYQIRNQKEQAIDLVINHSTSYGYFDVIESTHEWIRKNGDIRIVVAVPAKSEVEVAFTIRYDRTLEVKVN